MRRKRNRREDLEVAVETEPKSVLCMMRFASCLCLIAVILALAAGVYSKILTIREDAAKLKAIQAAESADKPFTLDDLQAGECKTMMVALVAEAKTVGDGAGGPAPIYEQVLGKLTAASVDLVDNFAFLQWAHVVEEASGEGDIDPGVTESEPKSGDQEADDTTREDNEPDAEQPVIEEAQLVDEATQDETVDGGDASGRLLQETEQSVDSASEPAE